MELKEATIEDLKKELERRDNLKNLVAKQAKFINREFIDIFAPNHIDLNEAYYDDEEICSDTKIVSGIEDARNNDRDISCVRCALLEIESGKYSLHDLSDGQMLTLAIE